jgi:hypothetical protein
MAISTVAHVRQHSNTIGSARLLLLIIASHVSPTAGYAWPSIPTLAHETKLSVRHVYRLIRRLEAMGELDVMRRAGRVNVYRVTLSPASSDPLPTPDTIPSPTPDTMPTAKSSYEGNIARSRLETWLTPGSRVWHMLTEGVA